MRMTQEEPWAKIPHWVVTHPDLDASAIRVYGILSKHANRQRNSFPGIRRIADEAHCAKSTVQRSLEALERVGAVLVTREFHGGRPKVNRYHLPMSRFGQFDGPIIGTSPNSMSHPSVHDGPIVSTSRVPTIGTELEDPKNQLIREDDFALETPKDPRLPGESRAAYARRLSGT